jgi:hypothetical protein
MTQWLVAIIKPDNTKPNMPHERQMIFLKPLRIAVRSAMGDAC